MFRLPISGLNVALQYPAGADDILLLEAAETNTHLAMELVARLSAPYGELCWETLPAGDLEALLLMLRQIVFGDTIRAGAVCPARNCRKPVDVSFRISDFLKHHAPRRPRSVVEDGEPGWWRLTEPEIRFRFPTAADRESVSGSRQPAVELRRLCVRPYDLPWVQTKRVERALDAMAPILSGPLAGKCPECQSTTEIYFDVERFVLSELRDQAAYLYRDVHLLAKHYHWPEQTILVLPRYRRLQYAEMLLEESSRG
jgi:hypothetical protein